MNKYKKTVWNCYIGYIVQAVVNNLLPLFFVIFREKFNLSNQKLGSLILINFLIQITVDILASRYGDRLGYRWAMILSHGFAGLGLIFITVLPLLFNDVYIAFITATFFFAIGGGMIEVMVSPLLDGLVQEGKGAAMSFLHSFYCWGQMLVVLFSSIYISIFGEDYWYVLPILWSLVPLLNMLAFIKAELPPMLKKSERTPIRQLFRQPMFIIFVFLMFSAGSSELAMSQWASFFAEKGLGVPKLIGDILGPCLFAVFMGIARVLYGIFESKLPMRASMLFCAVLCVVCYLAVSLSMNQVIAFAGCAISGFSVGLMWPGTYSMAGSTFKGGGTAMFGVLALFGDMGCSLGPWLTGVVSGVAEKSTSVIELSTKLNVSAEQLAIKLGFLVGVVFPLITVVAILISYIIKCKGMNNYETQRIS